MSNYCQLWLSCANKYEADKIAKVLLEKKLIACAKQISIKSDYRWQGKIVSGDEVLLVMESREDLFDQIEQEVAKLHSYDSFVLEALLISKVSRKANSWLAKELKNG